MLFVSLPITISKLYRDIKKATGKPVLFFCLNLKVELNVTILFFIFFKITIFKEKILNLELTSGCTPMIESF